MTATVAQDRAVSAQAERSVAEHYRFFLATGLDEKAAAIKVRDHWAVATADAVIGRLSGYRLAVRTDCYRAAAALVDEVQGRQP